MAHLAGVPERPALLAVTFYAFFEDNAAAMAWKQGVPQQGITTNIFAEFIAYFVALA
ncbi:MAG: hypothetical protein ACRYFV_24770 [Janthinobacterium lividum]